MSANTRALIDNLQRLLFDRQAEVEDFMDMLEKHAGTITLHTSSIPPRLFNATQPWCRPVYGSPTHGISRNQHLQSIHIRVN